MFENIVDVLNFITAVVVLIALVGILFRVISDLFTIRRKKRLIDIQNINFLRENIGLSEYNDKPWVKPEEFLKMKNDGRNPCCNEFEIEYKKLY